MRELPTGTVTFLFTDIEGSTARWERDREAMSTALARHDELLREAIQLRGGAVFKTVGDAFCAAFARADDALACAAATQRALADQPWGEAGPVRVRMAIHSGSAEEREGDYFGPPVNRVARLLSLAHGGQVLLSRASAELARGQLPSGAELRDLGLHRLKDLTEPEHVFQLGGEGLPSDFAPLKSLDARPTNLPLQATTLVGRERERDEVCEFLRRPHLRLLTLSGPGGTGKTRLALQTAAELLDEFEDGAFFVELAAVSDPALVLSTIAQTIGLKEEGADSLETALTSHLAGRALLLVLDNFEQVTAAGPGIAELLAGAPRLKVVVTSRFALRLSAEQEYPVPPLTLPDPRRLPDLASLTQYEAVRLFIERAQAVKLDFEVTSANAPAVAEICVRLDGLPLAIELAAARSKLLPPESMLRRLGQRLDLLTGGARDLPERQQTLRGAIGWSYELLEPAEQALVHRLAVFSGGCSLEAVELVCDGDLDVLGALVDRSLVRQRDEEHGEPRFDQLETIREYALERLAESGEAETLARRHAEYYVLTAERAEERILTGEEESELIGRLEAENDNLRAALAWCAAAGELELELRLASALSLFWVIRGHLTEGRRWLEEGLSRSGGAPQPLRAKTLAAAGGLAYRQGDYERSRTAWREALDLFRELDDVIGTARMVGELGNVAVAEGDYEQALALYGESGDAFREAGDRRRLANVIGNMGAVANIQRDYERGRELCEEALAIHRELGSNEDVALVLNNIGRVDLACGRYGDAAERFREGLEDARKIGYREVIAYCLEGLGEVAAELDDADRASRLIGASEGLFDEIGVPIQDNEGERYAHTVEALRSLLGESAFEAARAEGRAMPMEAAIAYALE
jgi:predicted ATPase/class 3 adenylate cyclase